MTTALESILNQGSQVNQDNDAASSSHRPTQALHNRACANCVRAKAKCSIGVEVGGKCGRCHRMNKHCQPSPPMRKIRTVTRRPRNRTSKLEEKLDGLVQLLKSDGRVAPGVFDGISTISPPVSVPSAHQSPASSTAVSGVGYTYDIPLPNRESVPESTNTSATTFCSESSSLNLSPVLYPALDPNSDEAESRLNKFRTSFANQLPFIVIPLSVAAHQLHQERPILWLCIVTVTSKNSAQQAALSREVRGIFGREVYVEGNRNMDLLLAVLVFTAWDRRHCPERPLLVSLVQLAIALIYDLGLDKPPSKDPALLLTYDLKGVPKPSRITIMPTMEERRALLGCFLMSSIPCSFLGKGDSLRWTTYSEECLRVIETQKEYESDALLVQLVKLNLISEKVTDAPWSNAKAKDYSAKPPAMFYLKSLENQLHEFRSNVPSELKGNKTLLMELCLTDLSIHDIGLSQAPGVFSGQYNRRLECLCACLNAAKTWVDIFFDIPPAEYVGFSIAMYANMTRCLVGIYRLLAFEHPEWDRGLARESTDIMLILEQAERNFSQVKEAAGLDYGCLGEDDYFNFMASKLRAARVWIDASIVSTISSLGIANSDEVGDLNMELFDDDWLRELMGPWGNQLGSNML